MTNNVFSKCSANRTDPVLSNSNGVLKNESSKKNVVVFGFLIFVSPNIACAESDLYLSPQENLETLDIAAINSAKSTLDIAMYAFTDKPIANALIAAANRGVKIRLYRDKTQVKDKNDVLKKTNLLQAPSIKVKVKNNQFWNIMHLKAYLVDGRFLREGSANWSPAGEGASCFRNSCGHKQQQDNTLLLTDNPKAVELFKTTFERIWNRPSNFAY
jgi:phosphatidylserine/phosphatidylglycerophosphate/cardiolipin synthase-like enzyme